MRVCRVNSMRYQIGGLNPDYCIKNDVILREFWDFLWAWGSGPLRCYWRKSANTQLPPQRECPQRPAPPNPNNSPQFAMGHSPRISLSADYIIPNNSPQFAMGHSLRLPRLSALRLVTGRCSLGSAIRTVHWTVLISAPRNAPNSNNSPQFARCP